MSFEHLLAEAKGLRFVVVMTWKRSMLLFGLALVLAVLNCQLAWSQATVGTGSIEGTVSDPTAAVVAGAKVTITNQATGQVISTTTSTAGTYTSGALTPGSYKVRVAAPNFKAFETVETVQIGVVSPGNVKLELGEATSTVEVTGEAVAVNTEQAEVSGTLIRTKSKTFPSMDETSSIWHSLSPACRFRMAAISTRRKPDSPPFRLAAAMAGRPESKWMAWT